MICAYNVKKLLVDKCTSFMVFQGHIIYKNASKWPKFGIEIVYFTLCVHQSYYNNNNNSLHLYSAFLGTQSALHRRGNLLNHHQCVASTWMMRRQPYCAKTPTTHHQLIGVMKTISVWELLGGHDGQRLMGKFGHDAGVTPLLFFEGHPGIFNGHRESWPRFNVSSEGGCFFTV